MTSAEIKLIKPDLSLKEAYLRYCDAFRAAGEPLNPYDELAYADFNLFVQTMQNAEYGIGLPGGFVPYTMYWLVGKDNTILGNSSLRHHLTPALEDLGGHIGYRIQPEERRKGYGTRLLGLVLEEAREMGLERVMVTCNTDNIASARIIESNGGILSSQGKSPRSVDEVSRYWIELQKPFILFPAIDLRQGKVVRLMEGDPDRMTLYSDSPADTARRWLDAGASWLHVVNLDGAFGDKTQLNLIALEVILQAAQLYGAQVQFGGGMRSLESVGHALNRGVTRAILGTLAVQEPQHLRQALQRWGSENIAASLDARAEEVRVQGWQEGSGRNLFELSREFASLGLRWLVYTDISRDGMQTGYNQPYTHRLACESGLQVIASGGVRTAADIASAKQSGLAGIILGRALYEGNIDLAEAVQTYQQPA